MPGPKPKSEETRRRRNATPGFRQLPPEGFTGPAPKFPLPGADVAEITKWEELWMLPQAVEWERNGSADIVAVYVRVWYNLQLDFDTKLLTELRQLDSKIGLSPKAMSDLRWEVASTPQAVEPKRVVPERPRLYVPDPDQLASGA